MARDDASQVGDEANREPEGGKHRARHRIKPPERPALRGLSRRARKIESDIEAEDAERDYLHDALKGGDAGTLDILNVNQQSEYDVYSGSQGPASTRPWER